MRYSKQHVLTKLLLTAVCFASSLPSAGSNLAFTYGFGSGQYQSYDFRASFDIPKLPVQFELNYNHVRGDGTELLTETGAGFSWNITDWAIANFRYLTIKEDVFEITGQEYGVAFYLNPLWKSSLNTRLDIGLGDYQYDLNVRQNVQTLIAGRVPDQRRFSLGLSQELTKGVSVYGNYDEYHYTADPAFLASRLLRRFRQSTNAAVTLTSVPKYAYGFGVGWDATDKLSLRASYANTSTVIGQIQDSQRLGLSYEINDALELNSGVTLSYSNALLRNGNTVIPASTSAVIEFGLRYAFP